LYKMREFDKMGFSGFEGRHYSLFENFEQDMGRAADLQTLVTALAYKYMAQGIDHRYIPDTPSLESERRQIFFGTAIGIPTFFVRKDSANLFLQKILRTTKNVRPSRRYPGYLRVYNREYHLALVQLIREDGADLVELLDLHETLNDLEQRLVDPHCSAVGRLTSGILGEMNASSPLKLKARDFNCGAEQYYRTTLRQRHLGEAYGFLRESCQRFERESIRTDEAFRPALRYTLQGQGSGEFLDQVKDDLLGEQADIATLRRVLNLMLLSVQCDGKQTEDEVNSTRSHLDDAAPIHRAV
ncbi:MAG: hypothetical protein HXX11_07145, partial [Desulfuromonadales bacterium]|nr:hypothetical protein [Desulfuromonadales bacterium]